MFLWGAVLISRSDSCMTYSRHRTRWKQILGCLASASAGLALPRRRVRDGGDGVRLGLLTTAVAKWELGLGGPVG